MLAAIAMFASSCGNTWRSGGGRFASDNRSGIIAGRKAESAAPEVNDICDVDSLEAQRNILRTRTDNLSNSYKQEGGVQSQDRTNRLLNDFDAEIDAAYRNVTSSCRAYSRCMQNNYYNEGSCRSTLSSWERSRDEFADLSRELREIEAEVERDQINRPVRRGHRRGVRLNRCECNSNIGPLANCCDKDSDQEAKKRGW